MRRTNRWIALALLAALLLAIVGCTASGDPSQTTAGTKATTVVATTARPTDYSQRSLTVAENLETVFRPLGRTYVKNNRLMMDFSCSGIEFTADCSGDVKVEIQTGGWQNYNRFTVYVDGVRQATEPVVQSANSGEMFTVASGLTPGVHTIRVVNQTQFVWSQASFGKVEITGEFGTETEERELFFEFYGDSIVNGSNVRMGGGGKAATDATQAFAWLTAENLNADMNLIGCSAIGLTKNSRSFVMKDIWDWNGAQYSLSSGTGGTLVTDGITKYDFARIPNAVVIELGVNDSTNASTAAFKTALTEMINNLRGKYGADVPIVLLNGYTSSGAYQTAIPSIISDLGGESVNLYVCNLSNASVPNSQGGDGTHPNIETSKTMANELTAYLKTLLNIA